MTPEDRQRLISEVAYKSYVRMRMAHPEIEPEEWAWMMYGAAVVEFEERFLLTFVKKLFEAKSEEEAAN
jgi:hypothetical protein